jgi:hypothetical protein
MRHAAWTFLISAAAALMAACTSVPLGSLPRLAELNPRTLDPSGIEVAVRLPDALEVATTTLTYRLSNKQTGEEIGDAYALAPVDAPPTAFLRKQLKRDTQIMRYRLEPDQAAALAAARDRALTWSKGQGQLTMSAGASFCLKPDANPFGKLKITFYLRGAPSDDFFTLISERSIKLDGVKRCGADGKAS